MKKGLYTGVAFLDLKKAFDTVDIPLLLHKLTGLGVHETELSWFKNYLTNRYQCVSIGGQTSETLPIDYGVPQGSVLGPLLFIIYINDLQNQIKQAKITLYADDTAIFYASKDLLEIQRVLNQELGYAHKWLTDNKLTLNVKKTKCMLFSSKRKQTKVKKPMEIKILGEKVEVVPEFKYLGLWFDSTLSWGTHIDKICAKVSQRLGIVRRIRNCLPQQTCCMLVQSMVLPILDYGSVAWSNCSDTLGLRLQRLQNRAGKLILRCPYRTPSVEVLSRLNWPSIRQKENYQIAAMVYKWYNGQVPPYLLSLFTPTIKIHSHNTRLSKSNGVFIQATGNNFATRKFSHRAGVLWNSLPEQVKSAPTKKTFKLYYKNILWDVDKSS